MEFVLPYQLPQLVLTSGRTAISRTGLLKVRPCGKGQQQNRDDPEGRITHTRFLGHEPHFKPDSTSARKRRLVLARPENQSDDSSGDKHDAHSRRQLLATPSFDTNLSVPDLETVVLTLRNGHEETGQSEHQEQNTDYGKVFHSAERDLFDILALGLRERQVLADFTNYSPK